MPAPACPPTCSWSTKCSRLCESALWALQDCSLDIPRGRVSALVGPNGAGKTTLLKLLAGLARATEGEATVLGRPPGPSVDYLASIGYLAQEMPLYRQLSGEEHLRLGAHLNRVWDGEGALERLAAARVPMGRPVRTLSGGQRAQIALAMALAKQPQLLLLDKPVAALDPLARHQFLASLASAVADGALTVLLSSHLLHDLERVCDHVVVLTEAHSQLCADIDDVLAHHRVAVGPRQGARFDSFDVQGVVPIAYAVFAVMVGLALGSLIRRPIPAIGATMVAFVALRATVGVYLRPHFMTPVTVSTSVTVRGAAISVSPKGIPDNAWVISQFFTGPRGRASGSLHDLGLSCHGLAGYVACLGRHGLHAVTMYQPDSRFWAFQGIESAIFVALAAICAGAAYLAVLRRDA